MRGNEPTAKSTASATPEGPPTAPLAPTHVRAEGQDQHITVRWHIPPAPDDRAPVTSYEVRYRQVGTASWQNVTRANDDRSALQEINNLTNRNHYEVQVAAVNHVGTGQWASVKATPQAPHANPPDSIGDPSLSLLSSSRARLGLYWEISRTDNILWGDSCTGLRSFRITWDGPNGRDKRADEWAAHINTNRGAGSGRLQLQGDPRRLGELRDVRHHELPRRGQCRYQCARPVRPDLGHLVTHGHSPLLYGRETEQKLTYTPQPR